VEETSERSMHLSVPVPFPKFPHGVSAPGETEAWKKWGKVFLMSLSPGWHVAFLPGHRVATRNLQSCRGEPDGDGEG